MRTVCTVAVFRQEETGEVEDAEESYRKAVPLFSQKADAVDALKALTAKQVGNSCLPLAERRVVVELNRLVTSWPSTRRT